MDELAPSLKIRGHHLLCLLGFRGLGYSKEFTERMGSVARDLRLNSTLPVTLAAECDVICAACPHNKQNRCQKKPDSETRIRAKDLAVLERLGLTAGEQIPAGEAWQRIRERIAPEDIAKICRRCQWRKLGYCAEGVARLREGDSAKSPANLMGG